MVTFSDKLRDAMDRGVIVARENPFSAPPFPNYLYCVAGGAALLGAWSLCNRNRRYKKKPSSFELSGGSIDAKEVKAEFANYSKAYGDSLGEGIREEERVNTAELVRYGLCVMYPRVLVKNTMVG